MSANSSAEAGGMPPTPTSSVSVSDAATLPATLPADAENSASDASE